jgi:hypothetical protein
MSNFMEGYEDVAARIKRWQTAFPVGRIETEVIHHDTVKGQILVKASVFREHEDILAAGIDHAYGDITNYPQSMRKWYVEDSVTSAIGRAISLVLETDKKPTAQDMAKVDYVSNKSFADKLADKITVPVADDPWTVKQIDETAPAADAVALVKEKLGGQTQKDLPRCAHGQMMWKTGKKKDGKPWGHMKCPNAVTGEVNRCVDDVIWYEIADDGTWQPQKKWA